MRNTIKLLLLSIALSSPCCLHAHNVNDMLMTIHVGDQVQNECWQNDQGQQVCLDDSKGNVRVLLYNAGWCGPCNSEFDELSLRVGQFNGKPVTFISLSGAGWSQRSQPNQTFLTGWRWQHKIPASVVVAGAPGDYGQKYGHSGIPNVAIVDGSGKLLYTETAPGVDAIFDEVTRALHSQIDK